MTETPTTPEREREIRAEVLGEVVAWLVKKAREHRVQGPQYAKQADVIGVLADKVQRGAVRPNNLRTLPPGPEPAPEDVPALRAEVERLRAELAARPSRATVLREAATAVQDNPHPGDDPAVFYHGLLSDMADAAERADHTHEYRHFGPRAGHRCVTCNSPQPTEQDDAGAAHREGFRATGLPLSTACANCRHALNWHTTGSARTACQVGRCGCQEFTAAECAHVWTTALDGENRPALDDDGCTWEHCGICGVPKDVATGKDTRTAGEFTRAATAPEGGAR